MKKSYIAILVILVLVLSIVLTSCDIEKIEDKKYDKYVSSLSASEVARLNEKAKTDYPNAFDKTLALQEYDMTVSIRLRQGSSVSPVACIDGLVKKNGSSYTGSADIKYAGIKIISASYKNTETGGRIILDESNYLDLPFNYGEVGSIIYLNLSEDIIANAKYVYNKPDTIKFSLNGEQTMKYFSILFNFAQEQLEKNDVSEINFAGLSFNGSEIYVTIENGIATSYYARLDGNSNNGKIDCSLSGKLQTK